jgi:hypothetical protein
VCDLKKQGKSKVNYLWLTLLTCEFKLSELNSPNYLGSIMFKKICVCVFTFILLTQANASVQNTNMAKENTKFMELLTYELQNRAFALNSVSESAKTKAGEFDGKVWAAYLVLEQYNLAKYKPIADKFDISQQPTVLTQTKTWLGGVFSYYFPKTALNTIKKATVAYVEKLKELEALSDTKDKDFFRYVVLQEEVQAQAMALLAKGEAIKAVAIIESFVENQKK